MKMECACCGKKFPIYKVASTSFTEEACADCINLMISELKDALDIIFRKTEKYECDVDDFKEFNK